MDKWNEIAERRGVLLDELSQSLADFRSTRDKVRSKLAERTARDKLSEDVCHLRNRNSASSSKR